MPNQDQMKEKIEDFVLKISNVGVRYGHGEINAKSEINSRRIYTQALLQLFKSEWEEMIPESKAPKCQHGRIYTVCCHQLLPEIAGWNNCRRELLAKLNK